MIAVSCGEDSFPMLRADLSSSMLKRNADLEQRVAELEVELHALEKEKDKASKARLVEVCSFSIAWFFFLFHV